MMQRDENRRRYSTVLALLAVVFENLEVPFLATALGKLCILIMKALFTNDQVVAASKRKGERFPGF